jgi:general secretion pathway protein I
MRTGCSEQGFSLIEVLVAFMILAMSLTVLMRIFSGGLANVAVAGDYSRALVLAQSQLARAGVSEPLAPGDLGGTWEQQFHWRQVVRPYMPWDTDSNASLTVSAYLVSVIVEWERGGRDGRIQLESVRLQPDGRPGGHG